MLALAVIKAVTEFFAGLEKRHEFFSHRHGRARARIAALPGCAMLNGERTEAAQLNTITARERIDNLIEDHVHDPLDIAMIKMRMRGCDLLHQF